jgi:very-short-patch-repair endonuclease
MRPNQARDRSDRAIEELSRSQHHIVTLAQLGEIGLGARAVCHRTAAGRLRRLHRGVYALHPPTQHGRWLAAVLACGPGAALSHRSAAELWDLHSSSYGDIDVSVRTRAGRSRAGLRVHRGRLSPDEVTVHAAIPCTTIPRTLLDLAASRDRRTLERAVDRAEMLGLFDLTAVENLIDRHRGRRGVTALAAVLANYAGPTFTRSAAEEHFLALLRAAGLPSPQINTSIAIGDGAFVEPDFLWPEARLIVEIDGQAYHARRAAFARDRKRDRRLALSGYETRRYCARELVDDPGGVTAEVAAFLQGQPNDYANRT